MSFFSSATASTSTAAAATPGDLSKDIEVQQPPTDSISCLAFSPTADILAVSSWDNGVRAYEVMASGQTAGKFMYNHDQPVLSVCWSKDGTKLFSGGADKLAKMYDVSTGQTTQVAVHEDAVRHVRWVDQANVLATGSWDKTLKYWDTRQQQPVATVQMPHKVYAMDIQYPLLVVGTAERNVCMLNLQNPTQIVRTIQSPLKHQTRCVACFTTGDGFALGSVEGRVAIQVVDEKITNQNFSFKCHRRDSPGTKDQGQVYAVNDISFHHQQGTFSTAGADGVFTFWDKDARSRLKSFDSGLNPISATAFNASGTAFAYAISYDWSKGHTGNVTGHPNKIMLHPVKEDEVKKRPPKK
ncbi:WD40 repeat-like protein [Dacryopinax primogenitus]|uniref:WD40 repeat-like protein n=1 Tax=Dacryopinax primogenitus (strain DJM 731) TaxID=1858805 RepID=M5FP78_DACPD|nr:WD40 repeat-like protein [Dacryopinax primogenitus]EJT98300.1 WD40 repeat-like protein [Dacryopinax primogenitus]